MGPALPIILGADILTKFLGGLFGSKSKKKKAEAERRAQEEALAARKRGWEAGEKNRGTRLGIGQDVLTGIAPSLGKGAPNYSIDPAKLAQLQAPRPFTDTLPADPRAGLGSEVAAGLFGQAGDILTQYLLGLLNKPKATSSAGNWWDTSMDWAKNPWQGVSSTTPQATGGSFRYGQE